MSDIYKLNKKILKKLIIQEIGESSITPFSFNKINDNKYSFEIEDDIIINVDFQKMDKIHIQYYFPHIIRDNFVNSNNVFNVGFRANDVITQLKKSNVFILLKSLSTVLLIIKKFINYNSPDALHFFPTEKENDLNQKENLYKAFLEKNIDKIRNYKNINAREGGFIIYKTN